jgi:hypothetical protein
VFRFHGAVFGLAFVFARRPPGDSAARLAGVRPDLIDSALPPVRSRNSIGGDAIPNAA